MTGQAARPDHERPAPTNTHTPADLTRWALGVTLPRSPQIGADRVGRVLVALVQYASADGVAFPSTETLARDVSGITRRDARNALDLLAAHGVITVAEAPRRGRNRRWRIVATPMAGIPATSNDDDMAGIPANPEPPQLAGELAGQLAGNMAGIPAPKRTEGKNPPTPQGAGGDHEHHDQARQALERIVGERWLPLDLDELLRHAYRLGSGDPWVGYRVIREESERTLDGMTDPAAALRARLSKAPVRPAGHRPPPPTEHEHGWTATVPSTCWRPLPNGQPCLAVREAVAS